ncbi:unnamed protein product [Gongylonema pulchrum]|uniref:Uncharacterized protein n=1 Tax=Gongylonema pulchrum TaxID=637853 RepID=A0A183DHY2_9BILA|nr:unnamed protein product [Gongylonema pulchrum]
MTTSTTVTSGLKDGDYTELSKEATTSAAKSSNAGDSRAKHGTNDISEELKDENSSEQPDSSFRTDPAEFAASAETTASAMEKISNALTRKLKKLRAESGAATFRKHPKSLKSKKLKVIFRLSPSFGRFTAHHYLLEFMNLEFDIRNEFYASLTILLSYASEK